MKNKKQKTKNEKQKTKAGGSMFLIEGVLGSKNLFSEKIDPFQGPVGYFGISRRYGVAGGTHAATCDPVVLVNAQKSLEA